MTIYAINKRTKEHRVVPRPDVLSNADWRYAEADADGWIPWHGGDEAPLPSGDTVEIELRDGMTFTGKCSGFGWSVEGRDGGDIIAYRPILDADDEPFYPTTMSPLAQALVAELGRGGTFTLEHQQVIEAALHEAYTPNTVRRRLEILREELGSYGIKVE